ncbi:hypothetical protein GCM10009737_37970 [Nocardioides lentus]|uniref:Secreted protein n=1 Tax=Nocardioides lentus TaxID=338077 RepID=A0ABN2PXA6_9ACTN
MPRTLWFVAGAGAGVYAVARARRLAEALTPDGLRDRVGGLVAGARVFAEEVRQGAAEREVELREQYGVGRPDGPAELTAAPRPPSTAPAPTVPTIPTQPGDPH